MTGGIGVDKREAAFEADHDDYSAIMLKALADRFAEAFAECLHARVRRDLWGYAPDETLDNDALIREEYRGIRPAPGYPACPEHTVKRDLFRVLDAQEIGMNLTEALAMTPAASVWASSCRTRTARTSRSARSARTRWTTWPRAAGKTAAMWSAPWHPTCKSVTRRLRHGDRIAMSVIPPSRAGIGLRGVSSGCRPILQRLTPLTVVTMERPLD